jgi:hypothetical protein
MSLLVLLLAASVVFVEGATELVCKSAIFYNIRNKLSTLHPFFKKLLGCGYCTSVWMSLIPAGFLAVKASTSLVYLPVVFVLFVVVTHRLSNFLHNINDKHFDKFYDKRLSIKDKE